LRGQKSCSIEKPWLPPHAFAPNPFNLMESEMLPTYQVFRTVQLMRAVARREIDMVGLGPSIDSDGR
jgi:hypothetical protein